MLGYQISRCGLTGDVARAREFVAARQMGRYMACANPHSLVVASRDELFCRSLREADLLLPDGAGIILASCVLGPALGERVAGFEFFHTLTAALAPQGARYFFLGSSEHVLGLIARRINEEFPEITVCGTLSPPFKPSFTEAENAAMVAAVNEARPDVLWVGMTAPKQEKWIYLNRSQLQVPFIGAIGAVFDFYAGTKKRPSLFWRSIGMEWLPRFLKEPRRLWERNFKSTPIFLGWVVRERVRQLLGIARG